MAGWTETARYSLEHLYTGCSARQPKFAALRLMECALGHRFRALLWFTAFGHRLTNPDALDCPHPGCGREGAVVG